MNKIIKKALETSLTNVNLDSLMEVLAATPNIETAAEIVLGLYQDPEFLHTQVKKRDLIITFESYDKWTKKVMYSYQEEEMKVGYFPKTLDKSSITLENFDSLTVRWEEGKVDRVSLPTGKMLQRTDDISLEEWFKLKPYYQL